MKKSVLIIGIILMGGALFVLGFLTKPFFLNWFSSKIIAQVNEVKITEADLKREMLFLRVNDKENFSNVTLEDVLDRMINDQLIINEARRLNIWISEETADKQAQTFLQGYTPEDIKHFLKRNKMDEKDWQKLIRKRLVIEKTIRREVEEKIQLAHDEVEAYYWTHLLEFNRKAQVHAFQIVVETAEQVEVIKKKLSQGDEFEKLATKYSLGPEKEVGGELGWVGEHDLPQAFSKVLFKLKKGKISEAIVTDYGYHIFMVKDKRDKRKISLEEAREEITRNLKLVKIDRAFQLWLEELRAKADINIHDMRGVK